MTRKTINPELLFGRTQTVAEVQPKTRQVEDFTVPMTSAVNRLMEDEAMLSRSSSDLSSRVESSEPDTEQIEVIRTEASQASSVKPEVQPSSKDQLTSKLISRRGLGRIAAFTLVAELAALAGHSASQQQESLIGKGDKNFKQAELMAVKNLADDHVRVAKSLKNLITGKYGE